LFTKTGLELDHGQCLAVDRRQRTSLEGVYAAGDITCGGMQVVTAAGEGAVAGMQAIVYVRKLS
jgi:thioredoxin reductase (NADPH)